MPFQSFERRRGGAWNRNRMDFLLSVHFALLIRFSVQRRHEWRYLSSPSLQLPSHSLVHGRKNVQSAIKRRAFCSIGKKLPAVHVQAKRVSPLRHHTSLSPLLPLSLSISSFYLPPFILCAFCRYPFESVRSAPALPYCLSAPFAAIPFRQSVCPSPFHFSFLLSLSL